MDLGARNVCGEPTTMGEGNHPILPTLPDRDRRPNPTELEAPGSGKREVVVAPTANASRDGATEGLSQHLRELPGQGSLVDIRNQRSKRCSDIGTLDVSQLFGPLL